MNENKRVLIVDDMHESIIPLLKEAGYEPVYLPVITREDILKVLKDFTGLIIRSKTNVDKELIEAAKNLKFVARAGAGIDKVDMEYLTARGIRMINAPEGNRDSLGEHALGLLLALLHRIPVSFNQIRQGTWDREGNRGIELKGKVVGIYGVGNMGKAFAEKLTGFGCEVIGFDIKGQVDADHVKLVSLDEFMLRTEILSIHVPLKEDTRALFDRNYLERFQQLRVVVNTARGEVMKTQEVLELLTENKLYGLATDVLENEKLSTYNAQEQSLLNNLMTHPNVIITPHVGGWTYESYARINEVIVDKLKATFGG